MSFWVSIGLGGILAGVLLGLSIGLGAWLGYGYWQARSDRKTLELYAKVYHDYYTQEKQHEATRASSEVRGTDPSSGPRDGAADRGDG